MEEVQMAIETECANCGQITQCYDDGEAYVCVSAEMCFKNIRIRELEARERRLKEAVLAALDWLDRFGAHAPIMFGGEPELYEKLRAALAGEEQPE